MSTRLHLLALLLLAPPALSQDFAAPIEATHNAAAWRAQSAIRADLEVDFEGRRAVDARVTFTPDAARSRFELPSGAIGVFDGSTGWVAPTAEAFPGARFHLLTWPYFAAVPYKLRDPGARLEELGSRETLGQSWDLARLTFAPGTGDAPDDWYLLYRDPATGRLGAMAYIVTFGRDLTSAEADPHAIVYRDVVEVGGIPIPTRWTFHPWSEGEGIGESVIGEARLRNLALIEADAATFRAPLGAVEVKKP